MTNGKSLSHSPISQANRVICKIDIAPTILSLIKKIIILNISEDNTKNCMHSSEHKFMCRMTLIMLKSGFNVFVKNI